MTPEQLSKIEARLNAATPGPWYAHATDDDMAMNARYVGLEPCKFRHDERCGMGADCDAPENVIAITLLQHPALALADENDENTLFIAHAWTDIGNLVAEVRRLRAAMGGGKEDA
jgi:hypothetical protein